MTDAEKVAALREAVGTYGDSLRECPVKYRGNGGAFCSRCGATPGHNCGLEIDAGFKLVKLVQHLTNPEPSVSTPPAADAGAPCTLADRVGTSATCSDRYANDEAAKALYDTWSEQPGWVPWVERGNSLMQSKARREVTL